MNPVVLLELDRTWGKVVVQRVGELPCPHIEFRAFVRDRGSTASSAAITSAELTRVIEVLTHERDTLLGHPKHTGGAR